MLGYNNPVSKASETYRNIRLICEAVNAYDLGYRRGWATCCFLYDVRKMFKEEENIQKAVDRGLGLIHNVCKQREMQLKQTKMY